jgi:hypothetical protein
MHKINTVHKNWVSAQIEKAPEIQGVSILSFGRRASDVHGHSGDKQKGPE